MLVSAPLQINGDVLFVALVVWVSLSRWRYGRPTGPVVERSAGGMERRLMLIRKRETP